jgi:glutamyl-Q tRNA(Asp) synthetase
MTSPVFRLAPSPNGRLHLGHAYSALLNQRLARASGGLLLLRLEDIDTTRCTPEFEDGVLADLKWIGISWEKPVRRQSQHFAEYEAGLRRLEKTRLVYPAFMSRGEMRAYITEQEAAGRNWPRDPDGVPLYPGVDKELSSRKRGALIAEGRPFAWRLDMDAALAAIGHPLKWREFAGDNMSSVEQIAASPEAWGDVIMARRDVPTSYHLSVVLDDALQGVTHVVRGVDLYTATSVHRVLQQVLDLPEPAYHHHRLILGSDGRKLSKSERSTGLAALREAGETPDGIRRQLGFE